MRKFSKKLWSVILTVAIGASFVIAPVHAMTVSYPKYYLLGSGDEYRQVETPVNGQFMDKNDTGSTEAVAGPYKCDVAITGGSGQNAVLFSALYDSSWNLINFQMDKKAQSNATDTLTLTQEIASGQRFKTFLWDNEINITPLTVEAEPPVILYFYCNDPGTVDIAWYDLGGTYTVWKNGNQVSGATSFTDLGLTYIQKHNGYKYTDTSAADGDTYVIKNGSVASETLTADFSTTSYAYVDMGKYVKGRNMQYLRNDNANVYHNSRSKHMNVGGYDCDQALGWTSNSSRWTQFLFKINQNYLYGSGNYLDVKMYYYDRSSLSGNATMNYYPNSSYNSSGNSSSATSSTIVTSLAGSGGWKSVTTSLSNVALAASTDMDQTYQLAMNPGTLNMIRRVEVAPVYNASATLSLTKKYADGIILGWTKTGTTNVDEYKIYRNGSYVTTTSGTSYSDSGLTMSANGTAYSYQVVPVFHGKELTPSNTLNTSTDGAHTITLPFNSGYENATASSSSESNTASEGTDYTQNGLTFRFLNNNRWRNSLTVARKRGNRFCRASVCTDRDSGGWTWADYRRWRSADFGTFMLFKVDNSVIPTTQRKLRFVFDYFDDSNASGQSIEFKYLQYNDGSTQKVAAKRLTMGNSNTWKTWDFTITDAHFTHNVNSGGRDLNDGNGQYYDFQIGLGGNYGGFATDAVNVYILMPD